MGDHAPATEPSLCHGPQRLQFWSKVFQIGTGFSDYDAGARNWNAGRYEDPKIDSAIELHSFKLTTSTRESGKFLYSSNGSQ